MYSPVDAVLFVVTSFVPRLITYVPSLSSSLRNLVYAR